MLQAFSTVSQCGANGGWLGGGVDGRIAAAGITAIPGNDNMPGAPGLLKRVNTTEHQQGNLAALLLLTQHRPHQRVLA